MGLRFLVDYEFDYEKIWVLLLFYVARDTQLPLEYIAPQLNNKLSQSYNSLVNDLTNQLTDNELNKVYTTPNPTPHDLRRTYETFKNVKWWTSEEVVELLNDHFDQIFHNKFSDDITF